MPSNSQAVSIQPKHSSWHKTFPIKMYTDLPIRALDGMTHSSIMFLKYGLLVDHTRSFRAILYNSLTLNRGYITAKRFSPVFSLMPLIRFLLKRNFLLYNKDSLTEFLMKNLPLGNTCRLFFSHFCMFLLYVVNHNKRKVSDQFSYGFSSLWFLWCWSKAEWPLKALPHWLHIKRFSPLCILWWIIREEFLQKAFSQWLHL